MNAMQPANISRERLEQIDAEAGASARNTWTFVRGLEHIVTELEQGLAAIITDATASVPSLQASAAAVQVRGYLEQDQFQRLAVARGLLDTILRRPGVAETLSTVCKPSWIAPRPTPTPARRSGSPWLKQRPAPAPTESKRRPR